jgi:hypothetical protein
LGCNICDNTSNVILTTIYLEGQRVKEMSGECGRDTNPRQCSVLICKASTNRGWRFRTTSISGTNHTQFPKIIFSADSCRALLLYTTDLHHGYFCSIVLSSLWVARLSCWVFIVTFNEYQIGRKELVLKI